MNERSAEVCAERQHPVWQADALQQRLAPLLPGLTVEVRLRVASTNSVLLERARTAREGGEPQPGRHGADVQPCLLVAEQQTAGRGRQGKPWQSSAGCALTFSLSMPMTPAAGWSGLSLVVGCALADALEPPDGNAPRLMLKWPNDLWLRDAQAPAGGRKLGGILVETLPVGAQRVVVIGTGLNVHAPADPAADAGLAHGRGCIDEIDPAATPPMTLARVALPLVQALRRFEAEGFAPFAAMFARRDLLAGKPLRTEGATVLEGTGAGVDSLGLLRLRDPQGHLHTVGSGEVSVRPC